MVKEFKRKEVILPVVLGLLFSFLYFSLPIKYTALAILALLGVSLVLYDLEIGLMAGVFAIPFLPDMLVLLYMYFLLAAYLYRQVFKEERALVKTKMDLPLILFFIVIVISTISSINFMGSIRDLALHIGGLSFLFVMLNTVDNRDSFNKVVTTLVFTASLVALYGLYQYVVGVEVDAAWVDVENNPDIRTRIYSVFMNPNIFAEYLVMTIPLSVGLFWYNKKPFKKLVFLGTSLLMSLALVLTLSRGGWLGFAFSALVFILLVERRFLLGVIPAALAGVYLLPDSIMNRIMSIGNLADSSNAYRIKMWSITGDIIRDNKWIGVGFGHIPFKQTFESYIRTMPIYHSHNSFLQITAELGIVGLLAFVFLLFIVFKYGIMRITRSDDKYVKYIGSGAIAGLAGVLLHGMVETVLYLPKIIMTFWMLVAFILTLVRIEERDRGTLK